MECRLAIATALEMEALGVGLARATSPGIVLHLNGNLAAGKTTLARGYMRALGHRGPVKSPTFTLVETYVLGARTVHHFDLYRLAAAVELEFIGPEEYLDGKCDCLIEWAQKGDGVLGRGDLELWLTVVDAGREVQLFSHTAPGHEALARMIELNLLNQ